MDKMRGWASKILENVCGMGLDKMLECVDDSVALIIRGLADHGIGQVRKERGEWIRTN